MAEKRLSLAIEPRPDGLAVVRGDTGEPLVQQHASSGRRPFIHPVHAPGGGGAVTEDAPSHHPWQHGLYVGLNDVNGVGFWTEGLEESRVATDGSFDSRLAGNASVADDRARWAVATDYVDPAGKVMLDDLQAWSLAATDSRLELDMTWTVSARKDLVFGEYEYGGLFLRVPYRNEVGGFAFDSEGQSKSGRRARWVAVVLPLPDTGRTVLAALLDHPGNPGSPVPWRIDHQLGVGPSPSIAGPWSLADGASVTFRYRLAVYVDPVGAEAVDEVWQKYALEAL